MADLQAVTQERHISKRWQRTSNYLFTQQDSVCSLGLKELSKAMLHMTIAFVKNNEDYNLVAVQGLSNSQNLHIDLQGRWIGGYIPALYRSYPFRMGRTSAGEYILCIDESSCLVNEDADGEAFFDDEGKPSAVINEVLGFLKLSGSDRSATGQICKLLQNHDLIEPWPISVQNEEKSQTALEGLYRISETKLNSMPSEAFLELRNAGALLVVYCQLLSMQNLSQLGKLATQRVKSASVARIEGNQNPGIQLVEDNGIISFENL